MASNWGQSQNNLPGQDAPVSILLAHKDMSRTTSWYQALQVDARFRITSMANDAQDFRSKLVSSPEVILLDATVFDGPKGLVDALTSVTGAVYLIVPPTVDEKLITEFKSIPSVKMVFIGDVNIAEFETRAYADALALRRTVPAANQQAWAGGRSGSVVGGLRIMTVWSRSGGTGRTTIALAIAQAVARKALKTLLIGLGGPDVLPLQIGLQPEPNILSWIANPTDEGLRASIQTAGDMHVLAGFPDILSEAQGDRPAEAKGSITELVTSAAYGGYAAIVLDTPSGGIAPRAVSAANTWLMIARPTVSDVWTSVEAFRTVTQKSAGQHRITPGNIFVVLNQHANGMLTPDEWHRAADAACRKMALNVGFPPVVSAIPYVPEVSIAQDNGRSALDSSDAFARPILKLSDMLFGSSVGVPVRDDSSVMKLGPLKIRTKK
ncbi:MAG: ParA family protein [Anaerolineales bacterium]|nr:ParA family protein [Anaerolineales bacterium]